MFSFPVLGYIYVIYHETAPRRHTHATTPAHGVDDKQDDDEDNHYKMTTGAGTGRGWDRQQHNTTKTAAHDEGDNKGRTTTEVAGNGYSTVRQGTQKRAQETTTSLGP
jgi:hypothetical protein